MTGFPGTARLWSRARKLRKFSIRLEETSEGTVEKEMFP